jgi:hypothetical protein
MWRSATQGVIGTLRIFPYRICQGAAATRLLVAQGVTKILTIMSHGARNRADHDPQFMIDAILAAEG